MFFFIYLYADLTYTSVKIVHCKEDSQGTFFLVQIELTRMSFPACPGFPCAELRSVGGHPSSEWYSNRRIVILGELWSTVISMAPKRIDIEGLHSRHNNLYASREPALISIGRLITLFDSTHSDGPTNVRSYKQRDLPHWPLIFAHPLVHQGMFSRAGQVNLSSS